jgi:hypothetical protein
VVLVVELVLLSGRVVVVVDVEVVVLVLVVGEVGAGADVVGAAGAGTGGGPTPITLIGVVSPGLGFQPLGGLVCDGTGPAEGTTAGLAGACADGGWRSATGVPGAWTRPNPARSDHHMELTCTTVPV